ncbi:MAG: hypothetical protein AAFV37_04655 [Pseudomonadota bacterium]
MAVERIMYIELKSGYADDGPAWIEKVRFSKSKRSIHFRGKELLNIGGRGVSGNYLDTASGEEYWVSGVKKNQKDRHWAGRGSVQIDPSIKHEYEKVIGSA